MIVRIATEGQYRVEGESETRLNELDNEAVAAVEAGDEARFTEVFGQMIELVRGGGALDGDELEESQIILPPSDLTFEEAGQEFTGEGLIPD